MLRFNRLMTLISLSVLLLSGCIPIVLPVPIVTTPAPEPAAAEPGELTLELLFRVVVELDQPQNIGSSQLGIRYLSDFTGGAVTGPTLQGTVLTDGEIWYLIRCDQIAELLMQGTMQTADGAAISFRARAFSGAAPLTTEQLFYAELLDPSDAFFRGVTFFETDAPRYDWLNHAVTMATYHYDLQQVTMAVYAIR